MPLLVEASGSGWSALFICDESVLPLLPVRGKHENLTSLRVVQRNGDKRDGCRRLLRVIKLQKQARELGETYDLSL